MVLEYLSGVANHSKQTNIYVCWDVRQHIMIGGYPDISDKYTAYLFRTKEGIRFLWTSDTSQPACTFQNTGVLISYTFLDCHRALHKSNKHILTSPLTFPILKWSVV
jgi:hypothetical protein